MTTINRVKDRRTPFVMVDHRTAEDDRPGWAARGILIYLLAKPDDWELRVEDLRRRGDLGRDAVYKLLKHLQEHGYVKREPVRDREGRLRGSVYRVFEVPDPVLPGTPDPEKQDPVAPTLPGNQYTEETRNGITTTTRDAIPPRIGGGDRAEGKGAGSTAAGSGDRDGNGGNDEHDFVFPPALSGAEAGEAVAKVAGLDSTLAQQLLAELAGRMAANVVRGSPLSYLRGLVERARAGLFTPEVAFAVAAARQERRKNEAALERAMLSAAPLPPADASHPLAKRVDAIRASAAEAERGRKSAGKP